MTELIQINNLVDYTKCSNYAKYNWNVSDSSVKSSARMIIENCYRDLAVLNKTTDWKTIRGRVYKEVFKETNKTTETLYKDSLAVLNALRAWYLEFYRDLSGEAISNLELQDSFNGTTISAKIDFVLVNQSNVTLVEFSNISNSEELLKDIGIRTKIYLLGKEKISVNNVLVINTNNNIIKCTKLTVYNPVEWNYKTYKALQVILSSIKLGIFYPSPTKMCDKCPYKQICSW